MHKDSSASDAKKAIKSELSAAKKKAKKAKSDMKKASKRIKSLQHRLGKAVYENHLHSGLQQDAIIGIVGRLKAGQDWAIISEGRYVAAQASVSAAKVRLKALKRSIRNGWLSVEL